MVERRPSKGLPADHQRIAIDTNVFIYFLEDHPRYALWCTALFDLIEQGHNPAVTSTITLLELLVQPYREQKEDLAQKIFSLTGTYPKINWVPVTMDIADRAAELRARYRVSTSDSIQSATAINDKAVCFYGNDRSLQRNGSKKFNASCWMISSDSLQT
ncbi:MAG: PIN domain-containing protein [Nitrospirales bacterium]|nr:PIN domain-containing protein [Nitrospirales bacterium]